MRVVVAMSGGVDSSVAAARLKDAGHDVVGVSMRLFDHGTAADTGACCSLDDLCDARRVAARLGIPHHLIDLEAEFRHTVLANFVDEYAAGRTPLPCARCNAELKFSALVAHARALGADGIATGHYARTAPDPGSGRIRLLRGADPAKDQSYFLFALAQAQLAIAHFPVGEWTKGEVRRFAAERGIPVADKPDSQEICFVADGAYPALVERERPEVARGGPVVDPDGRQLGRHAGVHRFTVGQRRGLGLSAGRPLYVIGIDAASGTVTVGPRSRLERSTLTAARVNWIGGKPPDGPCAAEVQVRYRHAPAKATLIPLPQNRVRVEFRQPQLAVTPGQAAVFYSGLEVLGGGWIE
jgi:tRNA-specific 2-thiouridylase